ncbi:MAG: cytochrome c maturation protein CcmE [Bdellovibrionales bacterium]|nr:cytochrome c maturation protein CcmE [Bdellovibrionales bacterium]
MNKLFVSLVVGFVVIGGLLLYQATQTGTSLVLSPSELQEAHNQGKSLERIRVGGRVAEASIDYQLEPEIRLSFTIQNPGPPNANSPASLTKVIYEGLKPDMFASGRDVIIDGDFRNGVLYASTLLTQCPSKYEPPSPVASSNKGQDAPPSDTSNAS